MAGGGQMRKERECTIDWSNSISRACIMALGNFVCDAT